MADSSVAITAGTGTAIDTRTAPDGNHRQVMVIGDESLAVCAEVTDPASFANAANSGSQGPALNVNTSAIQKATYIASFGNVASGTLTANTAKAMFSIYHAATATRTVRIRRINVGGIQTTGVAGSVTLQLYRGTAASSGGTGLTAQPYNPGTPAAEATCTQVPTITAATLLLSRTAAILPATANTGFADFPLVDFQEAGEMIPFTLRAGSADSLVVSLNASGAMGITTSIAVAFTEE